MRDRPLDPPDPQVLTPTVVASLRAGDEHSAALLDRVYGPALVRFCLGYLGQPEAAEDVVQDTFLKVLGSDVVPDNFRAWIYRICRNRCLDVLRARGRRRDDRRLSTEASYRADLTGHLTRLVNEERAAHLRRLLESLPIAQHEALRLRYVEGLSRAEIAEVLEIPVALAKSRIYEGLQKLRRHDSLADRA